MVLNNLYRLLADTLDETSPIELAGKEALIDASQGEIVSNGNIPLGNAYRRIFSEEDAHPVCQHILACEFAWTPPQTSEDPQYVAHSTAKAHVELIGPEGLVRSDAIRLGLYGMLPGHEYGIRSHLAEEVFVMLAGEADWKRGRDDVYVPLRAGSRSYHPSMLPHANRTRESAFMSVYIWSGDVSTQSYRYEGIGN